MNKTELLTKMKLLLFAVLLCAPLTVAAQGDVQINEENFPDENFRSYLLEQDYGKDGVITESEIEGITCMYVNGKDISSLKGIEYFTALTDLWCQMNQLTSLDVSKNTALTQLLCEGNQLKTLDVSHNTALTVLYCFRNQLTYLDVSHNTALKILRCENNQLTTLDVSRNTALTDLSCGDNLMATVDVSHNTALTNLACGGDQLTTLDVSHNTALTDLTCTGSQLTSLDVSYNTALKSLRCRNNLLTTLDLSHNTALTYLDCGGNLMTTVDLSHNTALTDLICKGNMTSLDISHNTALTYLHCEDNPMTTLDVSHNTALTNLRCENNQLTSLDVSHNTALTSLSCDGNQLTSLNVSGATALTSLSCNDNHLTSLDVSEATALDFLECSNNQLPSLNVSGATALTSLYCDGNQLTSLDVSGCSTEMMILRCYNNQIKGESMDALINSLPQHKDDDYWNSFLQIYHDGGDDGNVCTKSQVAAAKARGWIARCITAEEQWFDYEGIDEQTIVSVGTDGLATYCPKYGADFSGATKIAAYKASVSGSTVALTRVGAVAAGEGVLLRSLDGGAVEEELPIALDAAKNAGNAFVGTQTARYLYETDGNMTNFVLSKVDGVVGFFKANNTWIAAGKAYLPVENYNAAAGLSLVFGDTTGITDVVPGQSAEKDAIYTLGGVRVETPVKGLYIKNGKKVFVK